MLLINGKEISEIIINELKNKVGNFKSKNIVPAINIYQIGDNSASSIYVKNKKKLCERLGVECNILKLENNIDESTLINLIEKDNENKAINGILVQLPLPNHINENKVIETISPNKDVDCFNELNVGKLWCAKKNFNVIKPCTPYGVIQMLKYSNIKLSGKNVTIIGRSNIVGKPLAALFLLEGSTPTICHSGTINLQEICQRSDILVAAIGKPKFVTNDFTNPNQVIIDVGINRDQEGKICGDVDFDNVKDNVYAISPVPGGVGPMTIAMLLNNLLIATELQNESINF